MKQGKFFAYAGIILASIIVQKSLIPILFGGRHLPDIVLMLILVLAVIDGFDAFLAWAVGAGLIYDILGHTAAGLHVLIFVFIVYLVSFFSRRFLVDMRSMGVISLLFFIVFATLISHLFVAAWVGIDSHNMHNFAGAIGNGMDIAIESSYNALVFVIVFVLARRFTKRRILLISQK